MRPNYQAWAIDAADYPHHGSLTDQLYYLIGYGILAPSTHNTQPWRFVVTEGNLHIYLDMTYQLPEADPIGRYIFISLGTCVFNIQVAAAHFGLNLEVDSSNLELEAPYVVLSPSDKTSDAKLAKLFPAITKRYSDKQIRVQDPLSATEVASLRSIVGTGKVELAVITDHASILKLADYYYTAAASYANVPAFGRELSGWLRSNTSSAFDGMPGLSSGLSNGQAIVGKNAVKLVPKSISVLARKYHRLVQTSPALGVVYSENTPQDWVNVGCYFEHLALVATAGGMSLTPLAAITETAESKELEQYAEHSPATPQLFFRVVRTPDNAIHSPRRLQSADSAERALIETIPVALTRHHFYYRHHVINYIEAGNGRPLILLHGVNMGWGQWGINLPELAKRYRVIALDLPGSGGSHYIRRHKVNMDRDIIAPVAALIVELGFKDAVIVGHSLGGAAALLLARDLPDRITKVVLVDPQGFTTSLPARQKVVGITPLARLISRTALRTTRSNMADFLRTGLERTEHVSEPMIDYYYARVASSIENHPLRFLNGFTRGLNLRPDLDLRPHLGTITQHCLIMLGENDSMINTAAVRRNYSALPLAELVQFDGVGHVPNLEAPEEFNRRLIDWIERKL